MKKELQMPEDWVSCCEMCSSLLSARAGSEEEAIELCQQKHKCTRGETKVVAAFKLNELPLVK